MTKIVLQTFTETIAAGAYRTVDAYSEQLTILSNTAGADISVGIGELRPIPLKAGLQYKLPQGETFNRLTLYNQSASETTVEFILSIGDIRDNRMSVSGQIDVSDVDVLAQLQDMLTQLQGDEAVEGYGRITVGLSAVQIGVVNRNDDRKGIDIQADPDNTDYIYLGYDATVSSSKWFAKLSPGQAFSRDNTRSVIYAISGTASQYVGYGEV